MKDKDRKDLPQKSGRRSYPGVESAGDISHLLLVSVRPEIQILWTILFVGTLIYAFISNDHVNVTMMFVLVLSFAAVSLGNMFFPMERYLPYTFLLFMVACLILISSLVYFTGNRESLLGFLYLAVPIYSAAYYSYPGTLLVSVLTIVATYIPFWVGGINSPKAISLAFAGVSYLVVGFIACYIIEAEKRYARESWENRRLLEVARNRDKDLSLIYNLSRKFSFTLDPDEILKSTISLARRMLSATGSLVFFASEGRFDIKSSLGLLPFSDTTSITLPGGDHWVELLEAGESVTVENVGMEWLPLPPRLQYRPHSLAAVPLFSGEAVSGFLICVSPSPKTFERAQLEILSTLAGQAIVALEKAELYSRTAEEKTKVDTILSTLHDGLIVTDINSKITQANPLARTFLGSRETLVGIKLANALRSSVSDCRISDYDLDGAVSAALEGKTVFGEISLAGDVPITVQVHFIPLADGTSPVTGIVLFLHDVTEMKRIDRMKSDFVSNVSHELRTPLTSIYGFVKLLLNGRAGSLSTAQERYLKIVAEQSDHLTRMIEDLLDLSKLGVLDGTSEDEKVLIPTVIGGVAVRLQEAASAKGIELCLDMPEGLPPVAAVAPRVDQVVTNLIDNAIKFTPAGGRIEISTSARGSLVQVRVADNGIGIPAEDLRHIFDRFFQARPSDGMDRGGFGLGLAISKELVALHGGEMWAESRPGVGSTFYFTLPVYRG